MLIIFNYIECYLLTNSIAAARRMVVTLSERSTSVYSSRHVLSGFIGRFEHMSKTGHFMHEPFFIKSS